MPLVPTSQEFRIESIVASFPLKLVGRIFRGLRKIWKILYIYIYKIKKNTNTNKNSVKICTNMPYCPTAQEFWLEYNVSIFAPKLADKIFSSPRKNWKIISNEKEIRLNFVQKRP